MTTKTTTTTTTKAPAKTSAKATARAAATASAKTTTKTPDPYSGTVAAIRGYRSGSDQWAVADALLEEVSQGRNRSLFAAVRIATERAGVQPLSVSAMRQYRDCAARIPEADRIPGVTFSAHRNALAAPDPLKVLGDLVAVHGPKGVTVAKVREAVNVANGTMNAPKVPRTVNLSGVGTTALLSSVIDRETSDPSGVAADAAKISAEGLKVLQRIVTAAKAARKAKATKAATWGTKAKTEAKAPAKAKAAKAKAKARKGGDLRGL